MTIEQVDDNLIYVALPKTPNVNRELEPVNDMIITGRLCNVILDFNLVDVITSSSISALLILQNLLKENGRQLILCNVAFLTKCEFTTVGLSHFFRFIENKSAALKALHHEPLPA